MVLSIEIYMNMPIHADWASTECSPRVRFRLRQIIQLKLICSELQCGNSACTKFRCRAGRNKVSCFMKLATFIASMSRTIKQRIRGFYWTLLMQFHAHQFRNSTMSRRRRWLNLHRRSAYVNEIWIFHLFLSSALDDLKRETSTAFHDFPRNFFIFPSAFAFRKSCSGEDNVDRWSVRALCNDGFHKHLRMIKLRENWI